MPSFIITNMAKADLKDIGRYTQEHWGRDQRDQYLTMIDVYFHQLAANPLKGKNCNEIREGYRKLNAGSHVIFYRQTLADTIEIVRVLHGRMDIETRLAAP
ncbi:MAG: type II toxin-antitoxin system RelE/ParE family toxin [bacterium]|nr:type II toxin-antitoxin system RelE/ParE family toxin [bacterium]